MKFKNTNGYVEEGYTTSSILFCLLFGPLYFLTKGIYKHAIISFIAACCTLGLSMWIYPFFLRGIVEKWYLHRGWTQVSDGFIKDESPDARRERVWKKASLFKKFMAICLLLLVAVTIVALATAALSKSSPSSGGESAIGKGSTNTSLLKAAFGTEQIASPSVKIKCSGGLNISGTAAQCEQLLNRGFTNFFNNGYLINVRRIAKDYEDNAARADIKYKGKSVFIEGKVSEISKDFDDSIYLVLGNLDEFGFKQIHAYLGPIHLSGSDPKKENTILTREERAARLNKGNIINATCIVSGQLMGMPKLEKCMLE